MHEDNQTVHVDWYSFALPTDMVQIGRGNEAAFMLHFERQMKGLMLGDFAQLLWMPGWMEHYGRKPYTGGVRNAELGISLYFGGQKTILCEVSGTGCNTLRELATPGASSLLHALLFATYDGATRIDFAVDIETKTTPEEFVAHGFNGRIRTTSHLKSDSGETFYVGSKKSKSRFARVYRYSSPAYSHRSHLLRIEMVAQKKHAKVHAEIAAVYGVAYAAQSLSNYFQWSSPEMKKLENHNEVYAAPERKSTDASRIAWLESQVAPAVRDLIARGVLTVDELNGILALDKLESVQERLL